MTQSAYDGYRRIEEALRAQDASLNRDVLKEDIIQLYRTLDREIAGLTELKEGVKRLVQVWKEIGSDGPDGEGPSPEPNAPPARGGPTRADHLNASSFIERGWSLMSLGDHAGAEASLAKALELAPEDPQALSLIGWSLMLRERYDDALLNFQRVLMKEPQNSLARINVGYICLKKRIFGEAIEHLSKAIRLDNDKKATLYAHYYLGLLYQEREMYEDAENFFRKSIKLGPNLIEAHYELGRSLWFTGRREDATQAWRDGAAANKFNPWAKRCAELLDTVAGGGDVPR